MAPEPPNPAQALRSSLRAELVQAMKARHDDAVAALRSLMASIDNAEAVTTTGSDVADASAHVAGARSGVGSTEARRRDLDPNELRRIVNDEVADRGHEANRYDALGRPDEAQRLRRQARVLAAWLERQPHP